MKEIEKRIAIMQKFSQGRKIEQKSIRSDSDWVPVASPSWNWDKNEYREAIVIKNVIKKTKYTINDFQDYRMFVLSINDFGRVLLSKNLYDILKTNERLVMRVYTESMRFDEIKDYHELKGGKEHFNANKNNSLLVIQNFLKRISSGVRRPDDSFIAKELSKDMDIIIKS